MSESDLNPTPRVRRPRASTKADAPASDATTPAAPAATLTTTVAGPAESAPAAAPPTEPAPPSELTSTAESAPPTEPDSTAGSHSDGPIPPEAETPGAASGAAAPRPRVGAGALVAVAAVAALVGGGSGAGIAAWAISSTTADDQESSAEAQTITVNDPDDVNVVNAVAAKAAPSVVTINVNSQSASGSGSGIILSEDGYVLTNNHVVTLDGASSDGTIEVTTSDGHIYSAEIVGTDPTVDLAVIKLVDASGLTPIEFGDVDELDVGDRAVAIGAPLGLSNTVTDGIVSVLDRSIQIESSAVPDDGTDDGTDDGDSGQGPFNFDIPGQDSTTSSGTISIPVIQTDASINPGNSGGALVNDSGELVGVVVAIATTSGSSGSSSGSIGVGFAIPADLAQRVANEIIENGTATHGLLGAMVRDATSADGSIVGAVIAEEDGVSSGGAAEAAGLQAGDIITEFDGVPITGSVDLTAQVRRQAAGSEAELVYVRDGEEHTVTVTLGSYEP